MHNSSLVAIAQYFGRIRTSVLYDNQKKFNTEAVNDYPPIRFEIRFERKFPIVGLYFLTLPVETPWNLCPVEKLFGMRMAGLCQFYWRTCFILNSITVRRYWSPVERRHRKSVMIWKWIQRGRLCWTCRRATRRSLSLILSSDWSDSLRVLVLRP